MNTVALLLIVLTTLASLAVAGVAWQAMTQYDADPRSLQGFEGMHFED